MFNMFTRQCVSSKALAETIFSNKKTGTERQMYVHSIKI